MRIRIWTVLFLSPAALLAQNASNASDPPLLASILRRLDALEQQNSRLSAEVKSLREQLAAVETPPGAIATPPVEDRVAVAERRIEEQDQTKVEASQKFPVKLQGMLLFNAFANNQSAPDVPPGVLDGPNRIGATFQQTLIGFNFSGPDLPGGGKVNAALNLDFSAPGGGIYGSGLEFRRAVIDLAWDRRTLTFGQDKPLISKRDPDSLAEVTTPALANAGDPWYWVPQVRYEERFRLGDRAGVNLEGALLQTVENASYIPHGTYSLELARPALEGRVELWTNLGTAARIEIAPGFHVSSTHLDYVSVPSHIGSLDWRVKPNRWLEFTGLILGGRNLGNLGGISVGSNTIGWQERAVHAVAGWTQISLHLTPRLTLNSFTGTQALKLADLGPGLPTHNFVYGGNLIYRLAPNILLGAEALQERAGYVGLPHTIRNHYDLSIGYLF